MYRGYLSLGMVFALVICALSGFPLDQFTRPLLIVVVLALVLSIIVGATPLIGKLLFAAICLTALTTCYQAVSHGLQQALANTWADPSGRLSIIVGTLIFLLVAVLLIAARLRPGRMRKKATRKLTGRTRVPVMLPEKVSSFDLEADVDGPTPSKDDFGLLS